MICSSSCGKGGEKMGEIYDEYDFQTIKRLQVGRENKVLPTAYSNTLSYYEVLEKLIYKVEELEKAIKDGGYEDSILSRANAYTDGKVDELAGEVRDALYDMNTNITSFETRIDGEFTSYKDAIDAQISRLNIAVTDLYNTMMEFNVDVDNRIIQMYNDLIRYIDEEIDARDTVYVIDPVTRQRMNIQNALWSMYNAYMRNFAVTAQEYDDLRLTATEYDSRRLTAYEYDNNFKEKMRDLFDLVMNPFTGTKTTLVSLVYQLVDLHRNSLTASEYDNLNLDATDYDALDITAYDFDFDNRTIFV